MVARRPGSNCKVSFLTETVALHAKIADKCNLACVEFHFLLT